MSKLRFENPFAMGNLDDLMFARENDDLEYLKEWSRKAVKYHERAIEIQLKAYAKLIEIRDKSSSSVDEMRQMLREIHGLATSPSSGENRQSAPSTRDENDG